MADRSKRHLERVLRECAESADVIYAHNDERNTVSCGPGNDTAYFDGKLDSLASDCEKQIPRQFEPPLNVPFDD